MNSVQNNLAEHAAELIELEFPMLAGVDDLADRLAVSKCHLIRCFSAVYGISPGKQLVATRLAAVRAYLVNDAHSVETIAGLTGFACGNYLSKVFRKAYGISPLEYRRQYGSDSVGGRTDLQKRSDDISFV